MAATFFQIQEFQCRCGCHENKINDAFVARLDLARKVAGVAFHINSGYRCKKHNKAVGGVSESSHCLGLAADIAVSDSPSRFRIIQGLLAAGINRIGIGRSLIHADCDTTKEQGVIWIYENK